jgi:hypothetical protein
MRGLKRPLHREAPGRRDRTRHVEADERVAELARAAGRAPVDPAAKHDATADSRADRQHHEVVGDQQQPVVVGFGERGDSCIVVDEHGDAQPIAEHLAQRHVDEWNVDRRDDPPGLELDHGRDADADRVDSAIPGGLDHLGQLID